MPIDDRDDAEPVGGRHQHGDITVLDGPDPEIAARSVQEPGEEGIGAAQIEQRYRPGLPVDTTGLDDPPVGASADTVFLQTGHGIVYTSKTTGCQHR